MTPTPVLTSGVIGGLLPLTPEQLFPLAVWITQPCPRLISTSPGNMKAAMSKADAARSRWCVFVCLGIWEGCGFPCVTQLNSNFLFENLINKN